MLRFFLRRESLRARVSAVYFTGPSVLINFPYCPRRGINYPPYPDGRHAARSLLHVPFSRCNGLLCLLHGRGCYVCGTNCTPGDSGVATRDMVNAVFRLKFGNWRSRWKLRYSNFRGFFSRLQMLQRFSIELLDMKIARTSFATAICRVTPK